jgi:MFS family permease
MVLGATPAQMGFMSALGAASTLVFGLLAGVCVDRMRRRPIMIAADLLRAATLTTIPMAAFAHRLTMAQLYVVIALVGFFTVFFDVAYQSYLPSLVEKENLLEGNSKLAMSSATAEIAGPSLAGILVQLITAPMAILFDALSFLVSAISIVLIRKREILSGVKHASSHPIAGFRFVFSHPLLRPLGCFSGTAYFFMGFVGPLYTLYAIRDLHLGAAALGIIIGVGGVGNFIGAAAAPVANRRFGPGWSFIGGAIILSAASLLVPLAHGAAPLPLLFLVFQQLIGDSAFPVFMINERTLRQTVAPGELLGRVNAAMQLLTAGVIPLGALAGGALAGHFGIRPTLYVSVTGMFLSSGWLIFSPLRTLRELHADQP